MKNLADILSSTNEVRFTETGVEIWVRSNNLTIENIELEKTKYNNLLQVLNGLEEDYDTLTLLLKICRSNAAVDVKGQPLPAAEIKARLLKSVTDEYGARDYLVIAHAAEMEKLKPIEELPKEIIAKEIPNG
jgi:hypothetical protein